MPRLSEIQTYEVKKIQVEYNGLEIEFEVDPGKLTLGWQDRVSSAKDAQELSDVFFTLVKGWDITDDDGNVLPTDVSALSEITVPTFVALSGLIVSALLPNAKTRS